MREGAEEIGGDGRSTAEEIGADEKKFLSFLHLMTWQHLPCIPRRCTQDLDFAMSAAGVDLINFFKGWGRSGGFRRLG